jgi:hypothetical protein
MYVYMNNPVLVALDVVAYGMYVCMYVCVCVCMHHIGCSGLRYVCVCVYIYIYIYVCMYVCINNPVLIALDVVAYGMYVYVYIYIYICMYV